MGIFLSKNVVFLYIVIFSLFILDIFLYLLGNGSSNLGLRLPLFGIILIPLLYVLIEALKSHNYSITYDGSQKHIYIMSGGIIGASLLYIVGTPLQYCIGIAMLGIGIVWNPLSYIGSAGALMGFIGVMYFVVYGDSVEAEKLSVFVYYLLLFSVMTQIGNMILYPKDGKNVR